MIVDVMGRVFGRLTVVGRSDRKSAAGALWVCECACGGKAVTTSLKLRNGHTTSCGCYKLETLAACRTTHGHAGSHTRTRTYRSWKEMRNRCTSPTATQWKWYGGRGVTFTPRWDDYMNFLEDMGERPQGRTLDRINSDGMYCKENCRWATPKQQAETNRGVFRPGLIPWNKKAT